jgi:hypothetical protein
MAQYRTSTYRAPTYTKTYTKSYSTTATKPVLSQPTKTYITTSRPKTVINTTIVHQPVYTHPLGWNPYYTPPVIVPIVDPIPVSATQPVMDVSGPIPQPVYYDQGFGVVGLVLVAVIIAAVSMIVIRKAL